MLLNDRIFPFHFIFFYHFSCSGRRVNAVQFDHDNDVRADVVNMRRKFVRVPQHILPGIHLNIWRVTQTLEFSIIISAEVNILWMTNQVNYAIHWKLLVDSTFDRRRWTWLKIFDIIENIMLDNSKFSLRHHTLWFYVIKMQQDIHFRLDASNQTSQKE